MFLPLQAHALETLVKGAPANVNPIRTPRAQASMDSPLTVKSVIIDQTAENPVAARDKALKAAPRQAFQKLVEQNMTPEEAKAFKYPDDKTIASLVQDFEVNTEQLSSTRYVASYNVRFGEAVRRYVTIRTVPLAPVNAAANTPAGMVPAGTTMTTTTTGLIPVTPVTGPGGTLLTDTGALQPQPQLSPVDDMVKKVATTAPQPQRQLLILPYYENMAGKTLLWEEGNPWRPMWQKIENAADNDTTNFIVPLGDIADVAAGSSDAVWSGDYRVIEKLRKNYAADEVVLTVVNKSGPYVTIDMYFFKSGTLEARQVLQPYVGEKSEAEALSLALQTVIAYLQNPPPKDQDKKDMVASISRELTAGSVIAPAPVRPSLSTSMGDGTGTVIVSSQTTTTVAGETVSGISGIAAPPPAVIAMPGIAGPTDIRAHMGFTKFPVWSDFQRRLTTMAPPVILELKSISGDGADFALKYGGNLDALKAALSQKGIMLQAPVPGTVNQTYGVTLAN